MEENSVVQAVDETAETSPSKDTSADEQQTSSTALQGDQISQQTSQPNSEEAQSGEMESQGVHEEPHSAEEESDFAHGIKGFYENMHFSPSTCILPSELQPPVVMQPFMPPGVYYQPMPYPQPMYYPVPYAPAPYQQMQPIYPMYQQFAEPPPAPAVAKKPPTFCGSCKGHLSEDQKLVLFNGLLLHPWCFKCSICGLILEKTYMSKNGDAYCEKDFARVMTQETKAVLKNFEMCVSIQPAEFQVTNTNIYPPPCIILNRELPRSASPLLAVSLVEFATKEVVPGALVAGDAREIRSGTTEIRVKRLKLNKMEPIKGALLERLPNFWKNLTNRFCLRFLICGVVVYSTPFTLLSSTSQLPEHLLAVRPKMKSKRKRTDENEVSPAKRNGISGAQLVVTSTDDLAVARQELEKAILSGDPDIAAKAAQKLAFLKKLAEASGRDGRKIGEESAITKICEVPDERQDSARTLSAILLSEGGRSYPIDIDGDTKRPSSDLPSVEASGRGSEVV
eukprot:TRINITY_DN6831_c0_g1_i2.p1 TRINITY_DN6831_c0_g1~~TRINITY_DN6831_c0_g1_i2.p1  ORF type:complete len:509 (+),score=109.22 TRINITY_DN6831_c0_g1_i2:62-1588(+)